jgi:protein-disulfide isomerase
MDDVGEPDFGERLEHGGAITALRGIELDRRAVFTAGAVVGGGALTYGLATGLTGGNDSGGGNTIDTHPATRDVDSQPIMGPSLGDGAGTIVAFEDPFCPSCRHFELQSFPTLKREYIDPGDLSFVYRGIPVVTRYSDVGVHALEATFDRSPEAFWQLKRGYYENQPDIRAGNVESKTESILQSIDDIDVASTMEDVRNRQYQGAVQADMSASRDAGVRGTPTFALFRDGSYVTQLSGAQSAATLANSVGL